MVYIRITEYPDAPGRMYVGVVTDPVTGVIVASVDEAFDDEVVLTEEQYHAVREAAEEAYEVELAAQASAPEDVNIRKPTLEDVLAVLSKETLDALDARMVDAG